MAPAPLPLLEPRAHPQAEPVTAETLLERLCALSGPADPRHAPLLAEVVDLTLGLADAVALRYAGRGLETDDLLQVARAALVAAALRYRPGHGAGFAAFAVPTIRGELRRHFRDCGWVVRPPRRVQELRGALAPAREALVHHLGREAADTEVAGVLGCTAAEVAEARRSGSGFRPASLDLPLPGGGTLGAALGSDTDDAARLADVLAVRGELARLGERDRLILRLRFEDGLSQAEIGAVVGVSQMQVSRLLRDLLALLRTRLAEPPAA